MKRASSALTGATPDAYPAPIHAAGAPLAAHAPMVSSVPVAPADIAPPAFYVAARSGDAAAVRAMLAWGRFRASAAEPVTGRTALMLAACHGPLGAVQELLYARANVHRTTDDGVPALSYAAMNGHADIVRALLRAGASSGFVSTHGHTALTLATARQHAEVIELLRADGAALFRDWRI